MYNATAKIVYRDDKKMVFRVYPDSIKLNFEPGQYGALGLSRQVPRVDGIGSRNGDASLIKRAYSVSSSILDDTDNLADSVKANYYEFYVDLVLADEDAKPRLSPRLFSLKDNDRIFLSPKIVGHHTLQSSEVGKNILFIATTTGEAPHNSMITQLLANAGDSRIANVVVGPPDWKSAYEQQHQKLMDKYVRYKYMRLSNEGDYKNIGQKLKAWLTHPEISIEQLGWAIDPAHTHVFLCGDPKLIGGPVKLGGWKYEYPDYGLMRIFEESQFKPGTRFQKGNISYETYW